MTSLLTEPQLVETAAANVAEIRSEISAATAAAAGPTTGVAAAAADEVSAVAAKLFGTYAKEYQALLAQAAAFHEEFAAALASAGNAYAGAEAEARLLLGGTAAASALSAAESGLPSINTPVLGLFMGGSGLPIPPQSYLDAVLNWVNYSGIPNLPINQALALFTPEGLYPLTGVKTLPLNTSVSQGVTILQNAINQALFPTNPNMTPQGSVAVLGYSQSAIISSMVMQNILNGTYPFPNIPSPSQLNFTLLGDIMNPNGGIFERFVGLNLPSLGLNFSGATPQLTQYGTSIYTLEYDGYADFPEYPINFLSDLNAFAGILYVHGTYPAINPADLIPGQTIITLPGSTLNPAPGGVAAPNTNYYMIPEANLPLLDPIRDIPVIGTPIADLLQPDLTYLVNWGYGNPMFGWSQGPANVPTPFGVIPPLTGTGLLHDLVTGTQAGIHAFVPAMGTAVAGLPTALSTAASTGATHLMSAVSGVTSALSSPASIISTLQSVNSTIANTISNAAAQVYAVLLPTADIANALLISVPSYDINLFLTGIDQVLSGQVVDGLVYAFGAPIAADTALVTLAGGFELEVILNAVEAII